MSRKEYYLKNKRKISAYQKKQYLKHGEKRRGYQKKYRQSNKKKIDLRIKKWMSNNKEYFRKYYKEWRLKNRYSIISKRYLVVYGITLEQVKFMYKQQKGNCAACGLKMLSLFNQHKKNSPCVDHCHKTGKIRGLVHSRCNIVLGQADDNPGLLRLLATYLDNHK